MMFYKSEYGLQRVPQKAEGAKLGITSKRNLFLFKVVALTGDEFFGQVGRDRAVTTCDDQISIKLREWEVRYRVDLEAAGGQSGLKLRDILEMMVRVVHQESRLPFVNGIDLRGYGLVTDSISEIERADFKAKIGEKTYNKLFKALESELVSLVDRGSRASGNTRQYFGGVREEAGVFSIRDGFAKSQALDKIEEKMELLELALVSNLGVVSTKTGNGEPSFFIRSGKPNTKNKFLETIRMMALNEVHNLRDPKKIVDILEQKKMTGKMPVLNSFMDNSSVKYASEKTGGMNAEHTEQGSLQIMREVAGRLRTEDLCFPVELSGRTITVIIPRPIVLEFPFSFGNKDSIEQARLNNTDSNIRLCELLEKKWRGSESEDLIFIADFFRKHGRNYDAAFSDILRNIKHLNVPETALMCLDALRIGLTTSRSALNGLNLEGRSLFNGDPESTLEFMYSSVLQEELGTLAISCKSGVDRTGTGAAILIAMKNHKEITGHMFRPDNAYLPWTDPLFKFLFTKAADEFCQDAHRVTREAGESLKAKDQAFFHKTYVVNVADRAALQEEVNALFCVRRYNDQELVALDINIEAASPIILDSAGASAPAASADDDDAVRMLGILGDPVPRGQSSARLSGEREARWSSFSIFSSLGRGSSAGRSSGGSSTERGPGQPVAPKKSSPSLFDRLLGRSATGEQPATGSMEHAASEYAPRGQLEGRTSSLHRGRPSKDVNRLVRERRSSGTNPPTITEADEF